MGPDQIHQAVKEFIKKLYGTQKECAAQLGVTEQTVGNWVRHNPRGILKHAKQIVQDKDTTFLQLYGEVAYREHELHELEPTKDT